VHDTGGVDLMPMVPEVKVEVVVRGGASYYDFIFMFSFQELR
jgi:hypothetical protein